ncbi:hypothetical protein MBOT_39510 [Mycobacterium botniense]|uniref:Uncharacterized protein n=1 Tax=Mycobacterium botniense TaxID=84962 RepID=A0A7I9Y3D6_9MYCO|nr:hypothetical protein MBOT_39510 [Mycobacterium botniense]
MPSARPLQNGPANSVIAVDSKPLSSTASTATTTMMVSASGDPSRSARPSDIIVTVTAIAITRTGRIREATRSDQRPTTMRPKPPSSWETVTRAPAEAIDQLWAVISQTSMNVTVTHWGIISSDETA